MSHTHNFQSTQILDKIKANQERFPLKRESNNIGNKMSVHVVNIIVNNIWVFITLRIFEIIYIIV